MRLGAAGVALAAVLLAPGAAQAARPRGAVIDLRPPDAPAEAREAARQALAEHVDLILDPSLAAALLGDADPGPRATAGAMLTAAASAYGKLDCAGAREQATAAAHAYLALADPTELRAPLSRALSIVLLCADSAGARSDAAAAARGLRALGDDPPEGVPAAVWSRYPHVDAASNVTLGPVKVETDPAGARIWIDLAPAGAAPVDQALLPGRHWVVAAAPGRARTVTEIQVNEGKAQTVHLALAAAPADPWGALQQRVTGWRTEGPHPPELGALMREAGVDVAVVLQEDHAWVWLSKPGAEAAEPADTVAGAVRSLTVTPIGVTPGEKKPKKRPKWIYGAVIGGVLLAAGFVYLMDAGEDVQRIEVSWP